MRPALALCLLCPAFWPRPGSSEHPTADRAACSASGACYSLHHATIKRRAAEEACSLRGGTLSTVHSGSELPAVLALLRAGPGPGGGSKDLLFWVALERGRSQCTLEREPLRGFSWLSSDTDDSEDDTLPWVEEPQLSCTVRKCAGLQVTGGVEPAGWKEMRCHLRADGYLCKYQFEALCPMPRPGAASNLSFRAPFRLSSSALDFSPPGTEQTQSRLSSDLGNLFLFVEIDSTCCWSCNTDLPNEKRPPSENCCFTYGGRPRIPSCHHELKPPITQSFLRCLLLYAVSRKEDRSHCLYHQ
ncbi:C-type lectin domain family 14 member A isoform X2 [Peromyscus leucopus]|uniref:C-type lectin domain family 14 member A isoform X2 n=1 Tax=Peromyscus leucopus TaxID=10041 RepID=UPI0018849759|nr:C-type lectin domain family 14 member A isoform X2 [Peromyscus leucopus]